MMVFPMRDPGGGIHERERLIVVLEFVTLRDRAVFERPAVELLQQVLDFRRLERIDSAFARFAFALSEIVHGLSPMHLPGPVAAARCAGAPADANRRTRNGPGPASAS